MPGALSGTALDFALESARCVADISTMSPAGKHKTAAKPAVTPDQIDKTFDLLGLNSDEERDALQFKQPTYAKPEGASGRFAVRLGSTSEVLPE